MESLDKVVQHYISVFNHDSSSLSPTILNYLNMILDNYSLEDVLHAIDLSFEELKHRKKPHPTQVIKVLQKNLNTVSAAKRQKETHQAETHKNKPQVVQDSQLWSVWKSFFDQLSIPKSLINKKELEKIPSDLRNFYIASIVCEYIYGSMSQEERKKVDRMVEGRLKLINISPEQDVEEIRRLLRIHFIKKIYGIPY